MRGLSFESYWKGRRGHDYQVRNNWEGLAESNAALFGRLLSKVEGCGSVLELGAGSGLNVSAIRSHLPGVGYTAVEINKTGCDALRSMEGVEVHQQSIFDFILKQTADLVFTKGVLIHIPPEDLAKVYDLMFRASNRYVAMVEYHSTVPYEHRTGRYRRLLWKRDFCADMMAHNPTLKLIDYGFLYKGDVEKGQREDLYWFLMEKVCV